MLEFMRTLWALDHALATRHRQIAVRYGVTGSQRLVVRIVGQRPGVSAGEVARVLHVHPSTLTPTLQALVDQRLLRRAPDPRDRRRSVLWLTRRGQRVDAAAAQLIDKAVRGALAQLPGTDLFAAHRVLHAVAASVGGGDEPPGVPAGTREARSPAAARATSRAPSARERPAVGRAAQLS